MSDLRDRGRDPFGGLFDACIAFLAGTLALTVAARLLEAIWPTLAIIGGCLVVLGGVVVGVRWWWGRW